MVFGNNILFAHPEYNFSETTVNGKLPLSDNKDLIEIKELIKKGNTPDALIKLYLFIDEVKKKGHFIDSEKQYAFGRYFT